MAQVMVNFRMEEEVKKAMELACKEMGMSMTTAFTIFATKVGREKRIPFEITAAQGGAGRAPQPQLEQREMTLSVSQRYQARLEGLCGEVRQALTAIHTAIPSSITGLAMERIRLLTGDELKDKAAEVSKAVKGLFSGRNAGTLRDRDLTLLEQYAGELSSIARELGDMRGALIPLMKSSSGEFEEYVLRLEAVSERFDGLGAILGRFWASTAPKSGAEVFQSRIHQAAEGIKTVYVLTALESLEGLVLRQYDRLDGQIKARLENDYLQTLELTLRQLGAVEQSGADAGMKAALCLRAVNVLSQVITDNSRAQREWDQRALEAEVASLERLAAMRGDLSGGMKPV